MRIPEGDAFFQLLISNNSMVLKKGMNLVFQTIYQSVPVNGILFGNETIL